MKTEVLSYKDIDISYKDKNVLSGFNLEINRGEKILLKGRSGSGKSTLLKIPMGFAHQSDGSVYFEKELLDSSSIWEARKKLAYICQDVDICEGNVKSLIDETFMYKANRDKFDNQKLMELLEYFNLGEDVLSKDFEKLSGGEKQRVGIITALLLNRDMYLLDEITSSLDSGLKSKVADYFLDHDEWTLLIVSHDREWERENVKLINIGD